MKMASEHTARAGVFSLLDDVRPTPGGISSRTLASSETLRVVVMVLDTGQELTTHQSPREVLVQVARGTCEFTLEGKPWRLKAGECILMRPDKPHAVRATAECTLVLVMVEPRPPAARRPRGKKPSTALSGRAPAK
jgi:quercetin dioxygenase-like cupin family protein